MSAIDDRDSTFILPHPSREVGAPTRGTIHRAVTAAAMREQIALAAIAILSALLALFRLDREGYGNTYDAAAVRSMTKSWHNFFLVSFDPGGFVSVDKPPVGLWVQALSAKLFGFGGMSVLVPQAVTTVGSVLLLSALVRRVFGPVAALGAALALAVAPINVVTSRNNTADALLVFVLLAAAWLVSRAADQGSLGWLVTGFVLVGVGFNSKMLQAYLVLPAFGLLVLLAPSIGFRRRVVNLSVATVALLVVSFSWATIVELTHADARPYAGSSEGNSVSNLIFGYNGLQRLLPNGWTIFGLGGGASGNRDGGRVGGVGENGARGILRLVNDNLGGQIGWLLPLAVAGLIAGWGWPVRGRFDRRRQALVLWGGWLVTQVAFFSVASFYHR